MEPVVCKAPETPSKSEIRESGSASGALESGSGEGEGQGEATAQGGETGAARGGNALDVSLFVTVVYNVGNA